MSTAQGLFWPLFLTLQNSWGWAEVVFPLQRRGEWQRSPDWRWCCFMFTYGSPQTDGAHQQRPSEIRAKRPLWRLKYYFGVLSTMNKLDSRTWFYVTAQVVQCLWLFFFKFYLEPFLEVSTITWGLDRVCHCLFKALVANKTYNDRKDPLLLLLKYGRVLPGKLYILGHREE